MASQLRQRNFFFKCRGWAWRYNIAPSFRMIIARNLYGHHLALVGSFFGLPIAGANRENHWREGNVLSPACKNDQATKQPLCMIFWWRESLAVKEDIWMMPVTAGGIQISPLKVRNVIWPWVGGKWLTAIISSKDLLWIEVITLFHLASYFLCLNVPHFLPRCSTVKMCI